MALDENYRVLERVTRHGSEFVAQKRSREYRRSGGPIWKWHDVGYPCADLDYAWVQARWHADEEPYKDIIHDAIDAEPHTEQ